jgi:putative solute:sodium symporter small subunit
MREVGPMANEKITDSTGNEEAHWDKTTKLMLTHLGVWFFFGYVVHMFVVPLNKIVIPVLGFPLGFYMAAQGSLIVFVSSCSCSPNSRTGSTANSATPKRTEGGSRHGY